ncbi:NAD(P)-dependent alcohol dehydrogenase [Embleya hyalina]|uniref:NADPH:quinone reductase n=1 Tax=Embleya hyalina TaxID=516124 RepID=A0A401YDS2_9ACTN|nr:NAD(P)-dependent alcohol dehydrogenase [Embleya hyalina]GCD92751.1 NADPH:quinone reductase [Embleya hyalina]
MQAIVQDRYGSPDVLRVEEVDTPTVGANRVLVRVRAASVNARDWHIMRGDPYLARLVFGPTRPRTRIRGTDFAGVVEAVGTNVRRFAPGDEVFGEAEGTFAEYVAAPEDTVGPKPADLTFEQAAALPLAGYTALMGLRDLAGVRPGHRVLINGASGGVGTFAVQMAKAFGAEVTGVCSTRNVSLVESLGADHVVDYTRTDFAGTDVRYDVVFDLVGNRTLADCRRVLAPEGALVLSGGGTSEGGSLVGPMGLLLRGRLASRFGRGRVLVLTAKPTRENLNALAELAGSGRITASIERVYSFGEAPEAIRRLEVEHARAKVVIAM